MNENFEPLDNKEVGEEVEQAQAAPQTNPQQAQAQAQPQQAGGPLSPEKQIQQLTAQLQQARTNATAFQNQITQMQDQVTIAQQVAAKEKQRCDDLNAFAGRIQQDFENYRKRTSENAKKAELDGSIKIIEKVLPVMDVFKHAVNMINDEKVVEGLKMIYRQLNDILSSIGVEEIPALGERFNPELHNAIVQVNVKDKSQAGIIVEVFKKGYRLGDRIIRHSEVKVAN